MEIKTKFNIGNEVFWLDNLEISLGFIVRVNANISQDEIMGKIKTEITYEILIPRDDLSLKELHEKQLFATKSEVLEKLQTFVDANK